MPEPFCLGNANAGLRRMAPPLEPGGPERSSRTFRLTLCSAFPQRHVQPPDQAIENLDPGAGLRAPVPVRDDIVREPDTLRRVSAEGPFPQDVPTARLGPAHTAVPEQPCGVLGLFLASLVGEAAAAPGREVSPAGLPEGAWAAWTVYRRRVVLSVALSLPTEAFVMNLPPRTSFSSRPKNA